MNVKTIVKKFKIIRQLKIKELKAIRVLLIGIPITDLTPSQGDRVIGPEHVSPLSP